MLLVLPLVVLLLWVLLLSVLELVMELMRLPASFLVIVSAIRINRLDPTPSHLQQTEAAPAFSLSVSASNATTDTTLTQTGLQLSLQWL